MSKSPREQKYEKTSYFKETGFSLQEVENNFGRKGEYQTYRTLRHYENEGCMFLFNVYLNKWNGNTTECDIIMIHPQCVFVLESKNWKGWIFGEESSKYWMRSLSSTDKKQFYNPVMQNRTHIHNVRRALNDWSIPVRSLVVFSDECTFKTLNVSDQEVKVIHRAEINDAVEDILDSLPKESSMINVDEVYKTLWPFAHPDEQVKKQHNKDVKVAQGVKSEPSDKSAAGATTRKVKSVKVKGTPKATDPEFSEKHNSAETSWTTEASKNANATKKESKKKGWIALIVALLVLLLVWGYGKQNSANEDMQYSREESPTITTQTAVISTNGGIEFTTSPDNVTTSAFRWVIGERVTDTTPQGEEYAFTLNAVDFGYSEGHRTVTVRGTYENVNVISGLDFNFDGAKEYLIAMNQNSFPIMHESYFTADHTVIMPGGTFTIEETYQLNPEDTGVRIKYVNPNVAGTRFGDYYFNVE